MVVGIDDGDGVTEQVETQEAGDFDSRQPAARGKVGGVQRGPTVGELLELDLDPLEPSCSGHLPAKPVHHGRRITNKNASTLSPLTSFVNS